jgi:endonuclease YncB( thermonuclease family)
VTLGNLATRFAILCLLVLALGGAARPAAAQALPPGVPDRAEPATVAGHLDGDTLVAVAGGAEEIVRLAAVDAPDEGECYAVEAATRLRALIPIDAAIYLEGSGQDRDGEGRLVRFVWISRAGGGNAVLLNSRLVREGYAGFDADSNAPAYAGRIEKLANGAREDDEGLWENCGELHAPASLAGGGPADKAPTAEPVETVEPAAPTVAPPAEEESGRVGFTAAEQTYALTVAGYLEVMGDSFGRFGDLMQNPLIGDADWTYEVAAELATWKIVYEEAAALRPPAVFAEMHGVLLAALERYSLAADQIAYGLDNYDLDALNYALVLFEEGTALIGQANDLFVEIVAKRT